MSAPVLHVEITSETMRRLTALGQLTPRMMTAAAREMDRQNQFTVSHIQAEKLSERGPKTLGVITNRLRHSVRATEATLEDDAITSSIGSNVHYARIHEFGFSGKVTVREHVRMTAERFSIDNGRRTVSRSQAEKLGLMTKAGKGRKGMADSVPGRESTVRSHERMLKLPARAMFRTGIDERLPATAEAIAQAMVRAGGEA